MPESNFSFIKNTILRQNLDETFNHILIRLSFVEATSQKESIKSAFRKLRNEQHIGTHRSVKKYSRKDLEKVFFVASDVKRFVIKMVKS